MLSFFRKLRWMTQRNAKEAELREEREFSAGVRLQKR